MVKCKDCASQYSDQEMLEYCDAPSWDGECPTCTKGKFEKYLTEYLFRIYSTTDLVLLVNRYFGNGLVVSSNEDAKNNLLDFVRSRIYKKEGRANLPTYPTIGKAISAFIEFFDAQIKLLENLASNKNLRSRIVSIIALSILLITWLILIHILASFGYPIYAMYYITVIITCVSICIAVCLPIKEEKAGYE